MEPCPSPGVFFLQDTGPDQQDTKILSLADDIVLQCPQIQQAPGVIFGWFIGRKTCWSSPPPAREIILRRKHHGIGYAPHGGYY